MIYAQQDYYWFDNQKIYLTEIENKKFVVVDNSITNSTEIQNLFNDYNLNVTEPKTSSIRNQINCLNGYTGEKTWSIIYNSNQGECLYSQKHEIIYESPVYLLNGKELASSYIFYVRLKNLSDSIYLDSLANIHNVSLIGSNKFRPELYVLECNKFSTGNNVELSVLFHETGLFEYAEPDFVILSNSYHSSGCPSDPEFINQWGLENNTPNHTNVDISACDAWEITKGNPSIIVSVIDTGVELAHEDLACVDPAISWDTHNQSSPSQIRSNFQPYHGTCCAGIIGAAHNQNGGAGVAPDCTIMSISNVCIIM